MNNERFGTMQVDLGTIIVFYNFNECSRVTICECNVISVCFKADGYSLLTNFVYIRSKYRRGVKIIQIILMWDTWTETDKIHYHVHV